MMDHVARPGPDRARCAVCGEPIIRVTGAGTKVPGMGAAFRHRKTVSA